MLKGTHPIGMNGLPSIMVRCSANTNLVNAAAIAATAAAGSSFGWLAVVSDTEITCKWST